MEKSAEARDRDRDRRRSRSRSCDSQVERRRERRRQERAWEREGREDRKDERVGHSSRNDRQRDGEDVPTKSKLERHSRSERREGHEADRDRKRDGDREVRGPEKKYHKDEDRRRRHRSPGSDEDDNREARRSENKQRDQDRSRHHRKADSEGDDDRDRTGDRDPVRRSRRDDQEPERKRRRSRSPDDRNRRHRSHRDSKHRSREADSPASNSRREDESFKPESDSKTQLIKKNGPLPSQQMSFSMNQDPSKAQSNDADDSLLEKEKEKPNFAPTGLLAAETKTVSKADGTSIVLKYHEPPESRKAPPRDQWKLFVFKGAEIVDTIPLSTRSCWLVGREITVVDLPAEHPSISKQHAVIQFRYLDKTNEYGDRVGKVKPYLIDLDSANGTRLNGDVIPGSRYLELRDKDMVQFGDSTREYVIVLPPRE